MFFVENNRVGSSGRSGQHFVNYTADGSSLVGHARCLLRTLYCFSRLLPAFYVAPSQHATIKFRLQIGDPTGSDAPSFRGTVYRHDFPTIESHFVSMKMSVHYLCADATAVGTQYVICY